MSKPAIMVLDDKPEGLDTLERALRHRYEHDYLIISHTSAAAALGHLTELRAAGRPIAVVLAASTLAATSGTEFLATVRGAQPAAKRVLIVPRGGTAAPSLRVPTPLLQDRSAAQPVLQAMALGAIDAYLPAPGAEPDEQFHRGVSELLEEQARRAAPAQPAVWIIGEPRSARSHQLRDLLARNSIPYAFDAADSEQGRARLERAGQHGSALPVLVTYTGEVLVDPPTERLAAAFGLATLPSGAVDVAIIGGGPAGLSAAVYTAAEGLSTLLLERETIGGQAGSSSLIRNYLGFPHGITGASLATRAFEQAWSFGAITSVAGPVTGLQPASDGYIWAPRLAGPRRARPCRWKPACPASSPPATSVTAPSNVSPPPSAKAPSPPHSSPSTCKTTRDLRKGQKHENLPRAPRRRRAVLRQRIAADDLRRRGIRRLRGQTIRLHHRDGRHYRALARHRPAAGTVARTASSRRTTAGASSSR